MKGMTEERIKFFEKSHLNPQQGYFSNIPERELWCRHPHLAYFLSNITPKFFHLPVVDIEKPRERSIFVKYLGDALIIAPPALREELDSIEQPLLRQINNAIKE